MFFFFSFVLLLILYIHSEPITAQELSIKLKATTKWKYKQHISAKWCWSICKMIRSKCSFREFPTKKHRIIKVSNTFFSDKKKTVWEPKHADTNSFRHFSWIITRWFCFLFGFFLFLYYFGFYLHANIINNVSVAFLCQSLVSCLSCF